MKNYLLNFKLVGTEKEQLEQFRFILVNIFVFCLPYDRSYSTIVLFLSIVLVLFDLSRDKIKRIPRQIWMFQIVFFLSCLGYFLSLNKHEASSIIERQLAIIIFPLLLPLLFDITKDKVETILKTTVLSSVVTTIILFINIFYQLKLLHLPFSFLFSSLFINHRFSEFIGIHASYLSIYLSLAITFLIYTLSKMKRKSFKEMAIILLSLTILVLGLLFLSAKIIVIYITFLFLVAFPFTIFKKNVPYLIITVCGVATVVTLIFLNPDLKNRYIKSTQTDLNTSYLEGEINEPRVQRWKLGFEVAKEAFLLGNGTGDERDLLQEKYKENLLTISYVERFNVHNQFLSILIKHGIIGFLIFIVAFGYYMRIAIKDENLMYLFFLLGLLFFFSVENVLDANKGIFYFAFFNTLFGYSCLYNLKDRKNI